MHHAYAGVAQLFNLERPLGALTGQLARLSSLFGAPERAILWKTMSAFQSEVWIEVSGPTAYKSK